MGPFTGRRPTAVHAYINSPVKWSQVKKNNNQKKRGEMKKGRWIFFQIGCLKIVDGKFYSKYFIEKVKIIKILKIG